MSSDPSINYVASVLYVSTLFQGGNPGTPLDDEEVKRSILFNFENSLVEHPLRPPLYCTIESIVTDLLIIEWDFLSISSWLRSLVIAPALPAVIG